MEALLVRVGLVETIRNAESKTSESIVEKHLVAEEIHLVTSKGL